MEAAGMLLSGEPLRSTYRVLARNGRTVWLQCDVRLVRHASGEPWLVHGVAFDVTELKDAQDALARDIAIRERLEQQIVQSQKLESIGTLAAGLAHDFNNILTIIMGYARRLTQHGRDAEKVKGDADAITTAAARAAGLIRQLLTFAQKGPVDYSSLDLNATVSEFARIIRETFPSTIELALELDPRLPAIHGDPNQISQLLLNVAVNARDAMPEGGRLAIRTLPGNKRALKKKFSEAAGGDYVALRVSDSGFGMDESVRSRIFEPFFTTKETGKGTGLGLAVVYGIMQSHRGLLDVESAPGRGTTFHFYFPVEPRS
jgi:signal transduction histidine kinase